MNKADVTKLMSQLRLSINPAARKLRNIDGPEGRLLKLRKTVTALVKHERIELYFNRADEARPYMERLISDAIRHGEEHNETLEMANYWLIEENLVQKLFKVLVPRFENMSVSYTRMYKAPREYPGMYYKRAILELRGNPYPSLLPVTSQNRHYIHNVLLEDARKAFRKKKYEEMASKIGSNTEST